MATRPPHTFPRPGVLLPLIAKVLKLFFLLGIVKAFPGSLLCAITTHLKIYGLQSFGTPVKIFIVMNGIAIRRFVDDIRTLGEIAHRTQVR
jgi:hypothetical protein